MRSWMIGSIGVFLAVAGSARCQNHRWSGLPANAVAVGQSKDGVIPAPQTPTKPEGTVPEAIGAPTPVPDNSLGEPLSDAGCADSERNSKPDLRDCHFGPCTTVWAHLEWLWWWTKDGPLPVPLLNGPTGTVLGGSEFSYGDSPGARITVGGWFGDLHHCGFEASGFLLSRTTADTAIISDGAGNPQLLRPFTNVLVTPPAADNYFVSSPASAGNGNPLTPVLAGGLAIRSQSRLWGAEANFVRNVVYGCGFSADLLLGFRYLDLDENLNLTQTSAFLATYALPFAGETINAVPGTTLTLMDQFSTRNSMYAGQVGGRANWSEGPLSLDVFVKVALGPNHQQIRIEGSSQAHVPGNTALSTAGGLLALEGTNIGRTQTSWFSIAPEVGAQLGWHLTEHVKIEVGYNFLYINTVVRPGDQINTRVNPAFLPTNAAFGSPSTPAAPEPVFRKTDYWAHGITAGVAFRY